MSEVATFNAHPTVAVRAESPLAFNRVGVAVQASAQGESDIILVRLFVLEKVLFGLGQKKVDSILNGVVEKCPNIQRIELEGLVRPLTADEMQEAADEAQATLADLSAQVMASGGRSPVNTSPAS